MSEDEVLRERLAAEMHYAVYIARDDFGVIGHKFWQVAADAALAFVHPEVRARAFRDAAAMLRRLNEGDPAERDDFDPVHDQRVAGQWEGMEEAARTLEELAAVVVVASGREARDA